MARALGVEVGSPLGGGDGQFGYVRSAAWSTLTRNLCEPHAAVAPASAWDTLGALAALSGPDLVGPPSAHSFPPPVGKGLEPVPDMIRGEGPPRGIAQAIPPVRPRPAAGLGGLRNRVGPTRLRPRPYRDAPGNESRHVPGAGTVPTSVGGGGTVADRVRDSAEPGCGGSSPAGRNRAARRGGSLDAVGPKDGERLRRRTETDFSMDGNVFTGYLGLDYRLQPTVLPGLAVTHSQGDVDIRLTSVLAYAHWSPWPGLEVGGRSASAGATWT